jgi:hypothetical protein
MKATLVMERRPATISADQAEEAALRRMSAHLRAEAEELEPGTWLHDRLVADDWIHESCDRIVAELGRLMGPSWESDRWVGRASEMCPLDAPEEAALRRLAALMRAEAAELGGGSALGRRLESWGIRIALDCGRPEAPLRLG